jgi:hypothetical protein
MVTGKHLFAQVLGAVWCGRRTGWDGNLPKQRRWRHQLSCLLRSDLFVLPAIHAWLGKAKVLEHALRELGCYFFERLRTAI